MQYEDLRDRFARLCGSGVSNKNRNRRIEEARLEFDELCADPRVQRVGIRDNVIYVGTMPLVMAAEDYTLRNIGQYISEINPIKKKVTITSVGDVQALAGACGAQHPHVFSDGRPCFGPSDGHVKIWFGDGKYAHVALYSVAFLEVARLTNVCASPCFWPILSHKEVEVWKQQQTDTNSSFPQIHSIQRPSSSAGSGLVEVIRALLLRS